jgi:hypothetical protein
LNNTYKISTAPTEREIVITDTVGFIDRLPKGMASAVAERGATLSVGQKQLLSFARALAFDPRILVVHHKNGLPGEKIMDITVASIGRLPKEVELGARFYEVKFITPEQIDEIRRLPHVQDVTPAIGIPINSIRLKGQEKRFEALHMPWGVAEPEVAPA